MQFLDQHLEAVMAAAELPCGLNALRVFIAACIAHQFRRPQLARPLDFEEARLPFDSETQRVSARIRASIAAMIGRPDLPAQPDPDTAIRDLVAVIKGTVDAAGQRGETDPAALTPRVERAAFGYLRL